MTAVTEYRVVFAGLTLIEPEQTSSLQVKAPGSPLMRKDDGFAPVTLYRSAVEWPALMEGGDAVSVNAAGGAGPVGAVTVTVVETWA
jgi:hypothetical protein